MCFLRLRFVRAYTCVRLTFLALGMWAVGLRLRAFDLLWQILAPASGWFRFAGVFVWVAHSKP